MFVFWPQAVLVCGAAGDQSTKVCCASPIGSCGMRWCGGVSSGVGGCIPDSWLSIYMCTCSCALACMSPCVNISPAKFSVSPWSSVGGSVCRHVGRLILLKQGVLLNLWTKVFHRRFSCLSCLFSCWVIQVCLNSKNLHRDSLFKFLLG